MTVKIDEMGRLALPESIRSKFGIRPGDDVELVATSNGLEVRSIATTAARLSKAGPLTIFHADEVLPHFDLNRFIIEQRDSRHDARSFGSAGPRDENTD